MEKLKLLLHTCCAPCSGFLVRKLSEQFKITVFFDNSNIYPRNEYRKRKSEAEKFFKDAGINFIEADYNHQEWLKLIKGLENEPERGRRCEVCYRERLENTAQYAVEHNFDYFGSTLSVSPHKDADLINKIGQNIETRFITSFIKALRRDKSRLYKVTKPTKRLKFLKADFKKQDGFKKAMKFACEHDFYRQNYCGCEFSILKHKT